MYIYILNEESSQISDLGINLKKLEKEEQIKVEVRRKEIIKLDRNQWNKNQNTIEKLMKLKDDSWISVQHINL